MGTALNLQAAIGPLLGGILMATLGIRGALAVDAVTFVLSALVLLRVPPLPPGPERSPARFRDDLRAGLAYARVHPIARAVVVTLFLGVAFAGIDNVALVFLARNTLGAGPAVFGAIASSFGIGMLVASAACPGRSTRVSPRQSVPRRLGHERRRHGPHSGRARRLVRGDGAGAERSRQRRRTTWHPSTLIGSSVSREMLGRMYGLMSTASFVGGGLAYAAGGPLLDATSARTVFLIGAAGVFGVVGLAHAMLPKGRA